MTNLPTSQRPPVGYSEHCFRVCVYVCVSLRANKCCHHAESNPRPLLYGTDINHYAKFVTKRMLRLNISRFLIKKLYKAFACRQANHGQGVGIWPWNFHSHGQGVKLNVQLSLSRSGCGHLTVETEEKNAVAEALEEERCGLSEALWRSEFFSIWVIGMLWDLRGLLWSS